MKIKTLILVTILASSYYVATATNNFTITNDDEMVKTVTRVRSQSDEVENKIASSEEIDKGIIREATMYNAGDPYQCDDTSCISASGDNICNLLAKDVKICAANFVPLGTKLEIQNYGECVVLDRMNSRYKNRVDIAAGLHEKEKALKFGTQHLAVKIIK